MYIYTHTCLHRNIYIYIYIYIRSTTPPPCHKLQTKVSISINEADSDVKTSSGSLVILLPWGSKAVKLWHELILLFPKHEPQKRSAVRVASDFCLRTRFHYRA